MTRPPTQSAPPPLRGPASAPRLSAGAILVAAALAFSPPTAFAAEPAAALEARFAAQSDGLTIAATAASGPASVVLTGANGQRVAFDVPSLPATVRWPDLGLADGAWSVEVRVAPAGKLLRRTDSSEVATTSQGAYVSGHLRLAGGRPVEAREEPGAASSSVSTPRTKDQVVADDQIVQGGEGSLCVGLDCVNNEPFGIDELRLKENNTRWVFQDTSTAVGDPTRDWQLTANASSSGGASFLAISDREVAGFDGHNGSFRLNAGAPANAFVVSSAGFLGSRTVAPQQVLHTVTSDTPGLRLEQDNSQGFTPQTWDIAGNEANFFVRDFTSGSTLSLRVRPGAPPSGLDVASNGDVGVGTPRPAASMHVFRVNGAARARVGDTSLTTATRTLLELANNGAPRIRLAQSVAGSAWTLAGGSAFTVLATSGPPRASLTTGGSLTIAGTLSQGSSRSLKHDIVPLDAADIAGRVAALPVYAWEYRADRAAGRHTGPMAEDFRAAFGTGADPAALAPSDVAAAAVATLQSLARTLADRDDELAALIERLDRVERRLAGATGERP